ncbi:hypothetical protein L596_008827 [Steinernema carpocapsae]|uniref:Uncharacterized protein n=1 Tax=Steinernema carpocapsae TaxID=34508 RepID=A0A4U5PDV5_STECR|nr:hypothetical protein L596_008827 [Steinernema carpocapsae]
MKGQGSELDRRQSVGFFPAGGIVQGIEENEIQDGMVPYEIAENPGFFMECALFLEGVFALPFAPGPAMFEKGFAGTKN